MATVTLICKNCGKKRIIQYKRRNMKFCSLSCATIYNNKRRIYDYMKGNNNPAKRKEVRQKLSQKLKGKKHPWMEGKNNPNHKSNGGMKQSAKDKLSKLAKIRLRDKTKHPNWKGGITLSDRGDAWTEELRTSIRQRDKFVCQICNKNGFVVHHIDYDKMNNNPNNLITLCQSCHPKTNYNRKKWEVYFNDNR